ncbi:MBL fold metallo-hydrolase [Rasiella sp. SM2506]|uniref:MBL fold metallo-hydrolase n=1 Tax=Rasiella sp. SM2506 TaxID=3423914 RepID=UPI003D7B510C
MKTPIILSLLFVLFISCKDNKKDLSEVEENTSTSEQSETENIPATIGITPISHATMVLDWDGTIIYVDPVGGAEAFAGQPTANVILITDIHGDHFDMETLRAVTAAGTGIIAPKAVAEKIDKALQAQITVLDNGNTTKIKGIDTLTFEGIPMYNLREEALKFHAKGRGNGYVIDDGSQRVYISGDTEDIPEMRALEDIDIAFVCMNLPYTMTVKSAASAVADFKPKKVYPYHYRGTEGLSDVAMFKAWVMKSSAGKDVEVMQLDWYPEQ